MKKDYLDDELILDRVIAALVERPRTFSELFGHCAMLEDMPNPKLAQVDEALDILASANALQIFKDTRHGERMKVFALKSEARTYWPCTYCGTTGIMDNQRRGLCQFCHGNGYFTPLPDTGVLND